MALAGSLVAKDEALSSGKGGANSVSLAAHAMIATLSSAVLQLARDLEGTSGLLEVHSLKLEEGIVMASPLIIDACGKVFIDVCAV